MNKIMLLLFAAFSVSEISFTKSNFDNNFKGKTFDSVFICEFGSSTEAPFPADRKGLLNSQLDTMNFKKKVFLKSDEGLSLYNFLVDKASYQYGFADICWTPHLGIYFLNKGKIINYIEVCLDCNKLMSALRIKVAEPVKNGKIYVPTGLTFEFRKFINSLLVKYQFEHKINSNGPYDKKSK